MKLSHLKPHPVLKESIGRKVTADGVKHSSFLNSLANDLHEQGFPDKFSLTLETSYGDTIPVTFNLEHKEINDNPHWHMVTFVYELDSASSKKIHEIIMGAENADEDGEKFDRLSDELNVDTITVIAEFGKEFKKVFAVAR